MERFDRQRRRRALSTRGLIGGCVVSLVVVLISQFALLLVPLFVEQSSSLLYRLLFAVAILLLVAGFAKGCKRLFNVRASPPAMVLFHVLFLWAIYFAVVRRVTTPLADFTFNGGITLLIIGVYRILSGNPGYSQESYSNLDFKVTDDSISEVQASIQDEVSVGTSLGEASFAMRRVRYCKICEAWVAGFDHHCPAFGNCIGKKNRLLFMVLLVGFIVTEALYSICSDKYLRTSPGLKRSIFENFAASTMLFSLLQVMWQVLFFAWHVYCICFNITTDEWSNWKEYPEFHLTGVYEQDHPSAEPRYTNPYDRGILCNLKEFILADTID